MKTKITNLAMAWMLALFTFSATVSPLVAENADPRAKRASAFYHQGMAAMRSGNVKLAETSFQEVLKIYPTHPQARRQLLYLRSNRGKLESGKRKSDLHRVEIPQVNIENASVKESIEILAAQVSQASNQKVRPNFIVQDPLGKFKGKSVNLKLTKVPADTLLRYILEQAGGQVRFDKHAIVVTPRGK